MDAKDLFLKAVKAGLYNEELVCEQEVSYEEWTEVLKHAQKQNVLSLIFQSIYATTAFQKNGGQLIGPLRGMSMQEMIAQIRRSQEFLGMYRKLAEQGLTPIVVKGIICRQLLKNGDLRPSGDEDLYIPEGTYEQYKKALAMANMEVAQWDAEKQDVLHEVSYVYQGGDLRIEIHKSLFDEELSAFKGMNQLFDQAFERSIFLDIDGVSVRTMNHTDHMLFLILHAFKHFVTSGFGIRQIADMSTFANAYGKEIDWTYLLIKCKEIRCDRFAAAIFEIGIRYLGMDKELAGYPAEWDAIKVDFSNMLADIFDGGIYGGTELSRKHSANMTLSAVGAEKDGKTSGNSILKTLFPPREVLQSRYEYLQKKPWLLPLAWADRILNYQKERKEDSNNRALESLKIGKERIELMREYGIIK